MLLFVPILMVLCVLCYTGQTFFNRLFSDTYPGSTSMATPVYAGIYGIVVALVTWFLNGMQYSPATITLILGLLNGVILFIYNLGMIQAARRGPYAIQSIIMLFGSIVVCLVFSAIVWGATLTPLQIIGILIMLTAFVVLNSGGLILAGIKKGFFFWCAVLFFTNGFYGVLMDAQQRMLSGERNEMIITTFLSSALVSILYLIVTSRDPMVDAFRMGKKPAFCAVLSSVSAAFAVYLLMTLLGYVPSYILYTICNGGLMGVTAILCWLVLKEPISRQTLIGILLSIVSIVLLSI